MLFTQSTLLTFFKIKEEVYKQHSYINGKLSRHQNNLPFIDGCLCKFVFKYIKNNVCFVVLLHCKIESIFQARA